MEPEIPIDLSLRPLSSSTSSSSVINKIKISNILKPIPKPPWTILWYQNLWPMFGNNNSSSSNYSQSETTTTSFSHHHRFNNTHNNNNNPLSISTKYKFDNQILGINSQNVRDERILLNKSNLSKNIPYELKESDSKCMTDESDDMHETKEEVISEYERENKGILLKAKNSSTFTIVDIATCDGPVLFDRVLNPNFAVTVEHHSIKSSSTTGGGSPCSGSSSNTTTDNIRSNTYLCICCNQSFKSLFCYQKHKKRHLNPVTVDITSTNKNLPLVTVSENRSNTKDLNVQFFPCKKCGCKFPSYYFVHKHKKVCQQLYI